MNSAVYTYFSSKVMETCTGIYVEPRGLHISAACILVGVLMFACMRVRMYLCICMYILAHVALIVQLTLLEPTCWHNSRTLYFRISA